MIGIFLDRVLAKVPTAIDIRDYPFEIANKAVARRICATLVLTVGG